LSRNHPKLDIIDDTAYCGGMNIGSDYAGVEVGGNGRFLDAFCAIQGPALKDFVKMFLRSMRNTSPVLWIKLKEWCKQSKILPKRFQTNTAIQIYETDVLTNKRSIQQALLLKLNNAKSYCDIVTPYFLPPHHLERAILEAARRGIKIRLFTQGLCKTPMINEASNHILGKFIQAGVQVFKMNQQELHSKIMVVDGLFGTVGSFNFDILSFDSNMECGVSFFGSEHIDILSNHIQDEIVPKCRELTLDEWKNRPWYVKVLHWLSYIACNLCLSRHFNLKVFLRPALLK